MATKYPKKELNDIDYLIERIEEFKDELTNLERKSNEIGTVLNNTEKRRIDKLRQLINNLQLERQTLLDKVSEIKRSDNNGQLDSDWNEANEGSLVLAKKKHTYLKTYYDNFPDIDDITNKSESDYKKAQQFTESMLQKLPTGNIDEKTTVCQVLDKVFQSRNIPCVFYDSTFGKSLHDISENLAEIDLEDRPFVLKLNSCEGLGESIAPKTEHGQIRLAEKLTNVLKENQSDPIIEDIRERLSKAHGINKNDIDIKTIYVGSFSIVYTVKDLATHIFKKVTDIAHKLKSQFIQFVTAKIHPLLFRPAFDISYFDKQGDKEFINGSQSFQIGPPEKLMKYIQPTGWMRYGLKVLGRYKDGDKWLEPFQHPKNWYRAFHGTGNATSDDFGSSKQSVDQQFASVDAMANIFKNEFLPARTAAYGPGVYCSPDPKFPENGYVQTVELDTQQGKKKFKCMLQVAVNPNGVQITKNKDIWVVPNPQDIRPYGILIKEVP